MQFPVFYSLQFTLQNNVFKLDLAQLLAEISPFSQISKTANLTTIAKRYRHTTFFTSVLLHQNLQNAVFTFNLLLITTEISTFFIKKCLDPSTIFTNI
jgi:hypothetical protein